MCACSLVRLNLAHSHTLQLRQPKHHKQAAACGVAHLRSLNALLWVACLQLCFLCSLELQLQQQQQQRGGGGGGSKANQQQTEQQQRRSALVVAATLSLLPTHAFFAPLYYTDVAALAAITP